MFDAFISDSAARFNVPEPWVKAVIQTESSWNPDAYRAEPQIHDASYGLMQILYSTAQGLGFQGQPTDLYDPQTNIDWATYYLGQLRAKYGDDFARVYSAYNSGNPDRYETSSQVAANVQRALAALSNYIGETVETAAETASTEVSQTATEHPGLSAVILLLLAWAFFRR